MYQSKLIDVLSKFDMAKINNFANYLAIYKTKKENAAIRLFELIKDSYPNFNSKKLEKQAVHQHLFPNKAHDDKRLLNIMSDLLEYAEEFIAFFYAKQNTFQNQLYLLQFYLEADLTKLFESTYKQITEQLNNTLEESSLLSFRYQLETLSISYQLKYNERYSNYQEVYNSLNDFYNSQQYKLTNLMAYNLVNDVDKTTSNSKLLSIHQKLNDLIEETADADYPTIKSFVLDNLSLIHKKEYEPIINIFINYCIQKINSKIELFYNELLFWYDFTDTNQIILSPNNTISSATVKNYITCCIRLNLLDKAYDFLQKYVEYLDANEKEDVYNYNLSNILFHQHKYEESLVLLTTAKYKDIFYKISSKRLYIKIYYALCKINHKRYEDVLESSLNAFKKYVYTTKELTETVNTRNKSFYKYASKLVNLHKGEQEKLSALYKELDADLDCAERDWLMLETNSLLS